MGQPDYAEKFERMKQQNLYQQMDGELRDNLRDIAFEYRLTVQEFYEVVKVARDLAMWGGTSLPERWDRWSEDTSDKDTIIRRMRGEIQQLRETPPDYDIPLESPDVPSQQGIETRDTDKTIVGDCPVASEQTVCCNLKTIDVVENCPLGCSYCSIQTFYQDRFVFDENFSDKLANLDLDPTERHHICTGQSSDSLVWGNRDGILDELCSFSRARSNVTLELKTKTANVNYFLNHDVPSNLFCSWSLNPDRVVNNEEHFTADLDARLDAARSVANEGIPVGFHLHPMIYYQGWRDDYSRLARRVVDRFDPSEVTYVSFGSLTLIKSAIKRIRQQGFPTRILRMPMDRDPHGKVTYPDDLKEAMFRTVHDTFSPWHGENVFFYLCMEKPELWDRVFGDHYATNDEFERDMLDHLPFGRD